jgi:orotidine-5'-phosphate decarboxylase
VTDLSPRDRLIVALDMASIEEAEDCIGKLGDRVLFYKIGLELICAGGLALAERLAGEGRLVFVDLKLHDIPNTVERATAQISRIGATFLTVHGYPQTMRAALEGGAGSPLRILAVTALTSASDDDLAEAGHMLSVRALVSRRAVQAEAIGVHGIVSSATEVSMLRTDGRRLTLVCPGIRPGTSESNDQKRIATPLRAIRDGADYIVVGRPITRAADPRASAEAIISEIAAAVLDGSSGGH